MTTIALACALICRPALMTAPEKLHEASQKAGFTLYVPDEAARGYTLSDVETIGGDHVDAVMLTFISTARQNSYNLVESAAAANDASTTFKSLMDANKLPLSIDPNDTVVSERKGKTDITFVGSLISGPSAKKLLDRSTATHS